MRTNTGIFKSLNLNATDAEFQNAGFHNSIYREKNITSYLSDGSLWTRISSGKFDDLFIGDYFNVTLNGTNVLMRVACCNPFKGFGTLSTAVSTNHIMIIPDVSLENAPMNASGGTAGGYVNSDMCKTTLPKWVGYLETALGAAHVLSTTELLTNSVDANAKNCMIPSLSGASNNTLASNTKANLLSETEVCGHMSCSSSGYESSSANYGQLPLFRLNPEKIFCLYTSNSHANYWLRNVASSNKFCFVSSYGQLDYLPSDNEHIAVRPRFVIG